MRVSEDTSKGIENDSLSMFSFLQILFFTDPENTGLLVGVHFNFALSLSLTKCLQKPLFASFHNLQA